jgi:aminopeptidase C
MIKVSGSWTLDVVNNGVTSVKEWCDEHTPIVGIAKWSSHQVSISNSYEVALILRPWDHVNQ